MDPITLVGLFASLLQIVDYFAGQAAIPSQKQVVDEFLRRQDVGEINLPQKLDRRTVAEEVDSLLDLVKSSKAFIDRIKRKCVKPYEEVRDNQDPSDADLAEAQELMRRCICSQIRLARNENGGRFPNEILKDYFERFECRP